MKGRNCMYLGLAVVLVVLGGCNAGALRAGHPIAPPEASALPAPDTLDALRGASAEAASTRLGAASLSRSPGAVISGSALNLNATATGPGGGEKYEWAIYDFNPGDDELVSLEVQLSLAISSTAWIGLADYGANRWEWHGPCDASEALDLAGASYLSSADMFYCAVLLPAGNEGNVELVRLTRIVPDNVLPVADLALSASSGEAPLTVSFDGGGSDAGGDPGDSIVLYEWDFDGDGTYDTSGPADSAGHTYNTAGSYPAALRVTDSLGGQGTDSAVIEVTTPGNNAPVADLLPVADTGRVPLSVDFDASGSNAGGDPGDSLALYEWDWNGDGVYDDSGTDPSPTHEYTAPGRYTTIVRVTDTATNQDTAQSEITALPVPVTIDNDGQIRDDISMVLVDGNPAIAYREGNTGEIRFVRALDTAGEAWGAAAVAGSSDIAYPSTISLAVVAGKPAVVFTSNSILHYTISDDAQGAGWTRPVKPLAVTLNSYTPSLLEVNGRPAIAFRGGSGADLYYIRGSDATGILWGAPGTADTADAAGFDARLFIVFGKPAIAYGAFVGSQYDLRFVRALDASGSSWGTPLTVVSDDNAGNYCSAAMVSGCPAISYFNDTADSLCYVRALNPTGSAWGSPLTLDSGGYLGLFTCLALIDGMPAVAYYDSDGEDLRYIRAANPTGSEWGAPLVLDGPDSVGRWPSLVFTDGIPAIAYDDSTNTALRYIAGFPAS